MQLTRLLGLEAERGSLAGSAIQGEKLIAIKAEFAFDICWDIFQSLKAEQAGISNLDVQQTSDHCWRPRNGASGDEFMADFALAIRAPFKDSSDASRLILVDVFYISLTPYERARNWIGITSYMWSIWADEIREKAGKEIMRRGLFPPKRYFGERTRPRRAPSHAKPQAPGHTQEVVR